VRYLMMVMLNGDIVPAYEGGEMGEPDDFATMAVFNQEMEAAGVMLQGDGLHNTSAATRIEFGERGSAPMVLDGPFAEIKEVLGGFWIIQTATHEEAVSWARRAPMGPGEAIVLRRIMDMDEYTPEQQVAAGFNQA
jgi:hypothetical protein